MFLGVDYYPEHWPIEMMDNDLRRMKELGVNMIRIGEFAWHLMEKEEGKFDFSFFDRVIEKAKQYDMKVMFGTPTATFPAWLANRHPSILSENEDGTVRVFGGRRQYCYNSDIYRKYARTITEKLVTHYQTEEGIVVWQIDNEFGHEGSDMCHCDRCHEKFQQFLSRKYKNIEELNVIYGTIFWGQTYNDFGEIPVPKKTITQHNPSLLLDWARFRSYSLNAFAKEMTETARSHKGHHQEVTTNVSGGFFNKWFDHAENVEDMDFVSYDNYPVWGGLEKPVHPAETAMSLDFNRGLKNRNFWIVEEILGMQGHNVIGYLPRPGEAKMWSYQAFAHGCNNMLYFRWRGMTRGAEQFCYGIIDHDNSTGRKYREVQAVFSDIRKYEEVINASIQPRVAVLYDYDNIWSWRYQPQNKGFDFKEELLRLYKPFFSHNVQMDVIPVTRDFSSYDIVLVPCLQIIEKDLAERFEAYAAGGGTLVFSYRTGIKDKHNNIHFEMTLPGYVKDLAGVEIHDSESLFTPLAISSVDGKVKGEANIWRDIVEPVSAEVLYRYEDELFGNAAAITRNAYGKGAVVYIGCGADEDILKSLAKEVLKNSGIWHLETEEGLEVYKRSQLENYYFIMNHTSETKHLNGKAIKPFESKVVREL
ncbi:beta-galactosidase [Bacillus sp. V59.32b]|uniref:beta-galactosidase n=1 Tax=Bacillus sp. V59.32b TaxID=1758642 RepID=UPI000E3C2FC0|nr:beta-galactosidase [Bacillus sp. V59.32b]RFU63565.1 beta-galactosidase [Bacillus sp. V59.32b]